MSLCFLLDTNVVSEPLRPRPDPALMDHLRIHEAEIAIGAPVWHELRYGCERLRRSRKRTLLETFLRDVVAASVPVLHYDADAASWHAAERARLSQRGASPPFVDGQIAAIAAVNDLTLVTKNVSDFERFHGLRVVSWNQGSRPSDSHPLE